MVVVANFREPKEIEQEQRKIAHFEVKPTKKKNLICLICIYLDRTAINTWSINLYFFYLFIYFIFLFFSFFNRDSIFRLNLNNINRTHCEVSSPFALISIYFTWPKLIFHFDEIKNKWNLIIGKFSFLLFYWSRQNNWDSFNGQIVLIAFLVDENFCQLIRLSMPNDYLLMWSVEFTIRMHCCSSNCFSVLIHLEPLTINIAKYLLRNK